MDIVKSFTFVFDDKDWVVKLLIAAGILLAGLLFSPLFLVPLIAALVLLIGYSIEITRRVIHGHPQPLPEWNNWDKLIVDGLKGLAIAIVYALPILIIGICLGVPAAFFNDSSVSLHDLSGLLTLLMSCLNFLWAIALSLLLPAAIAFYAAEGEIGAAFNFGRVFAFVRDHIATYLITFLMSWVASIIGELGAIACGLGWFVTVPYSWMVIGHLYGQAYLAAAGQTPLPTGADVAEAG